MQTIARRAAQKRNGGSTSLVSDQKAIGTLSVYGAEVEAFTDHKPTPYGDIRQWAAMAIKKTQLRFEAEQSQEAALTFLANQAASA